VRPACGAGASVAIPACAPGDPDAIRKVRARRDVAYLDGVLARLDSWLPIVRRTRPPGATSCGF